MSPFFVETVIRVEGKNICNIRKHLLLEPVFFLLIPIPITNEITFVVTKKKKITPVVSKIK
jgi:hypothetical protein